MLQDLLRYVFSVTRLNEECRQKESSPFRILLVSEKLGPVLAIGGLRFIPEDVTIDNYCPEELDLLIIIPGGLGIRNEVKNVNLLKWIANRASNAGLTASVCTGSSLLGKAGLLDMMDVKQPLIGVLLIFSLRQAAPNAHIREDVRFTLEDPIFTSAGISAAGIDMDGPAYCKPFFGTKIGQATARHMEYPYPYQNDRRKRDDT